MELELCAWSSRTSAVLVEFVTEQAIYSTNERENNVLLNSTSRNEGKQLTSSKRKSLNGLFTILPACIIFCILTKSDDCFLCLLFLL